MTVIDSPIFQSVPQCLHVSFLMQTLPATSKSIMQSMLERAMEEAGVMVQRERGNINFGGLSPLEIRGQCAMVRGAVEHHLPKPEADVVLARYVPAPTLDRVGRPELMPIPIQVIKANAIRAVRDYCQPMLTTQGDIPTLAMAWSLFGSKAHKDDFSTRKIAADCKLSQSTVTRDVSTIKRLARVLETRAVERLTPIFMISGLVGDWDFEG